MEMIDPQFRRSLLERFSAIRKLSPEAVIPRDSRWQHTIQEIRTGGFIAFEDRTFQIIEVGRYEEYADEAFKRKLGNKWFELKLFCIETGETVNLEWEIDDEIEISITTAQVKFSDLRDDDGGAVDEDDLDQICRDEDDLFYKGKKFVYDDDFPAVYLRAGEKKGEKVIMYEFEGPASEWLTIEEWIGPQGKEEYQLWLSRPLDPKKITVLSLGVK